jgi:hypothetical protein
MAWDFGDSPSSESADDWGNARGDTQRPAAPGETDFGRDRTQALVASGDVETPPTWLLGLGLLFATVSVVIAFLTASATLSCIAWLLGGPFAIGALAVFLQADTRRRSHPWYAESSLVPWLRRGVVLLAIVAVALNAWTIADTVARGTWS